MRFREAILFDSRAIPLALALAAAVAGAETPVLDPGLGERLDLDVVEVEVVVLDREGRPVRGLGVDDFVLTVDGRETAISQFYALRPETNGALHATSPFAAPSPAPDAAAAQASRLTVALLVDDLTAGPRLRARALEVLGPFLATLPPGSRVSVARSAETVEIVQPLTADLAAAKSALEKLAGKPSRGGRNRLEIQRVLESLAHIHAMYQQSPRLGECGDRELDDLYREAEVYARSERAAGSASLRAPLAVARALAPHDGRKVLVHLSGGVDPTPGRRAFEAIPRICPEAEFRSPVRRVAGDLRLDGEIQRQASELAASGVTVFTLDLGGVQPPESTLGADLGFSGGPGAEMEDRHARQDAVFAPAADTGGRAFLDLAHPELATRDIATELASAYSLGFVPDHPAEGGRHRLDVTVRRADLRVRHRSAYRHATAAERSRDQVRAALAGGGRLSVLRASLTVGRVAPVPGERKRYDVSLWLRVPLAELMLREEGGGVMSGNLHLYLAARDERERESMEQALDVPFTVGADRVASGDLLYEIKAVMRPGAHRLALRVEDLRSGATDVLDVDVAVDTAVAAR